MYYAFVTAIGGSIPLLSTMFFVIVYMMIHLSVRENREVSCRRKRDKQSNHAKK